jgi:thiol-disulfide isomerase/thioredoxin
MAMTPSTMLELGTPLPTFELPDLEGKSVSPDQFESAPALLVVFLCPHCPVVRHIRKDFARFAAEYKSKGLAIVAINSNDPIAYPDDDRDGMKREIFDAGYAFPYLVDESQDVAKAYQAACTPDFFLFDRDRRLVYRGQFDDSRPRNNVPITGSDLRAAVDAVLQGRSPSTSQTPSVGCNIKWKVGNEPEYFAVPLHVR